MLRRADLALLTIEEPPDVSPLPLAQTEPTDGDEVQAIGYYLNIPTANRKTLRLGFEGKRLKDIIPPQVRRQLQGLGYPASGDHPEVRCGELTFQRLRRRPFAQIAASTDDTLGLQQILAVVGLPTPNFEVDIFQDVESGATFGVPSALDLESRGDRCSITAAGGIRLDVKGFRIDAPPSAHNAWVAEVQAASVQFEEAVFSQAASWQVDPRWSYWQPNFRSDGLVVRRKAVGFFGEANYWNIPSQYAFETLVARGDAALGVSAQNARNLPLQACLLGLRPDWCPPANQREAWSQLIVLTHLTTFPMH